MSTNGNRGRGQTLSARLFPAKRQRSANQLEFTGKGKASQFIPLGSVSGLACSTSCGQGLRGNLFPKRISRHDTKSLFGSEARTWLLPVSYVSRACLVQGGSSIASGMAVFPRYLTPTPSPPISLTYFTLPPGADSDRIPRAPRTGGGPGREKRVQQSNGA
jgi:hypothetical protein